MMTSRRNLPQKSRSDPPGQLSPGNESAPGILSSHFTRCAVQISYDGDGKSDGSSKVPRWTDILSDPSCIQNIAEPQCGQNCRVPMSDAR